MGPLKTKFLKKILIFKLSVSFLSFTSLAYSQENSPENNFASDDFAAEKTSDIDDSNDETSDNEEKTSDQLSQEKRISIARNYYDEARFAYMNNDFETAIELFYNAYNTSPHPAVLNSIAECKLQLGKISEALYLMEKILEDPYYQQKEKIKVRINEAKKKIGTLEISTTPRGAQIILNANILEQKTPLLLYLNPGKHELVIVIDDFDEIAKELYLSQGQVKKIEIDFTILKEELAPDQLEQKQKDTAKTEYIPFASNDNIEPPPAFWISTAVAGVGLISGTVFGTMALRDYKDYKDSGDKAIRRSGKRAAIITDVSFGISIAAIITGAIILIAEKKKFKSKKISFINLWNMDSQTAGVVTRFSF